MDAEVVGLLRSMLEVQAENLRLQRLLVERLLGAPPSPAPPAAPAAPPAPSPGPAPASPPTPAPEAAPDEARLRDIAAPPSAFPPAPLPLPPPPPPPRLPPPLPAQPPPAERLPPLDETRSRGARYYQPRATPTAQTIKPEDLELMRRLQQLREANSLILQFGPFKGTTLAQVAMGHPEYIRELVFSARRPEVRAAAGQLVAALDAAAEHKRKPARGAPRHGHAA